MLQSTCRAVWRLSNSDMVLLRYFPQVYLNYQRKSTIGWSVSNALTDMSGGLFSLAQQSLDAYALKVRASGCLCPGRCWPQEQRRFSSFSGQPKLSTGASNWLSKVHPTCSCQLCWVCRSCSVVCHASQQHIHPNTAVLGNGRQDCTSCQIDAQSAQATYCFRRAISSTWLTSRAHPGTAVSGRRAL